METRKSRRKIFPPYFHIFLAHVCKISRDFVTPTRAIFAMRSSVISLPGNRRFRCTLALGPITLGTRAIYGEKGLSRRYVRFIAPQNLSVQSATSIKEKKNHTIFCSSPLVYRTIIGQSIVRFVCIVHNDSQKYSNN